jgi:cobalt-zinc-cadmium efflux system membrane fusion protein
MTKQSFISMTAITAIIFALISCNGTDSNNIESKIAEILPDDVVELRADQQKLANITVGSIEMRSLNGTLKVNGNVTVAPQAMAAVCMPMGGYVKSTSLLPGNSVTKGQILAILESNDFVDVQENYLEAKSKLEYAEAEYKRHSELYKDDVYSQMNVEEVTAEYKSLKAQVKALEQKLLLIGINPANLSEEDISCTVPVLAPIRGHIKTVNVNIGKYVAPSDVMFEIVNNDKLLLELTLFEKDANKVAIGQKIRFFINSENEQHEAIIYQTGKSISTDKTYKVYAKVSDICNNVLPGMYVNAIIETSGNDVVSMPSDGIVSFEDKDYIFVFEKEKEENGQPFTEYRMIQVHKGVTDRGYTEVMLPEGFDIKTSKVVTKGAYNLLSAKKNAGEMAC